MSSRDAAIALRRFGLGPRPGEIKAISGDPRGFVLSALARPAAAELSDPDLEPSHVVFAEAQMAQIAKQAERKGVPPAGSGSGSGSGSPAAVLAPQPAAAQPMPARLRQEALAAEGSARLLRAITTDVALLERLVVFWSNHFCVSAAKGPVRGLAGGYEREAIRPHVLGRFADMLKAVEQHPAMLIYLDNQVSIGPNSPAGRNRRRGLNENLAREILELHTLGVDGGYTQADVTSFARILTGWSVGNVQQDGPNAGRFVFAPNRHEPGTWSVLGKSYPNEGKATGDAVLADLARHPATARHLALKLARHFISMTPPPALVARLAETFQKTDGDLAAVTRALLTADEAWSAPPAKIVPPYDYLVSLARGLDYRPRAGEMLRLAGALGQPLWMPPSPKGWPDDDDAWMGPAAVRERLRIAEMASRGIDRLSDPRAVALDLIGDGLGAETRGAIARAETREQGFQMLMMSPELLRR